MALVGLWLWCYLTTAYADDLTDVLAKIRTTPAVAGGIAWVTLNNHNPSIPPDVRYNGKRTAVWFDGQTWIALVGIPLATAIGSQTLIESDTNTSYPFKVFDKKYAEQRLTLKNKRQVDPEPDDLRRIEAENKRVQTALNPPWRATRFPLPLLKPVDGKFSSPFGLRRFFNGQARKPHSGLDISAGAGVEIRSPADGVIVEIGDFFFNGNSVFIDHGYGIVTMYCHMSEIDVAVGQQVYAGQSIGKVGMTGRATGPHLHWGVSFNGTMIDPMLVILTE
ncbi:peptidoglycan DD-metalloendopeptidase family protein [Beggiatoa leptomitoformis]|uniref:Peptidoglycan DD-metalloendopeptidase family protein n=2 Tax=Beggiatoa leptomitoformis TaxID=288004 RepID=A0A2N9YJS9_9GAMM|nr:peptidoglycan DD-metalloendopeptidase family protein [Beggiatoa leptomitoformis]AUI70675.1 peptidoglycan DD-metalloendopeptidase family protein [Beggiatoa leptomitoformis]